ncbi:GntR family transcriptional regulator [Bacillus oleivorans]|uniref:GntR family transcriptional regulator n=1 Tax=Bacillus oleivorans TaxID=1448271 RepID=A0A285D780_9BACI|nr:FadR/GntR family transcriptional regulator [Bacillus oleivorans]SNX75206.1 GntR family transcriptional regulator [Bacillus oleivorans]
MYESFKLNRKGVSSIVLDYIKQLIHEEKFKQGERLPGERQMAELLGVSRNSVREAYKMLEAMGYLTSKHGDGVYVSNKEEHLGRLATSFFLEKEDISDLYAIRKVLEVNGITWVIPRITEKDLRELSAIVDNAKGLIKENASIEQLSNLDHKFHLTLARLSGNSFLFRIMMSLIDLLEEMRIQSMKIPGRVSQSVQEHQEIVDALKTRDPELAKEAMLNHLVSVEKSLIHNMSQEEADSFPEK